MVTDDQVKVGDYVRIIKTGTHRFSVGDLVRVDFVEDEPERHSQPWRCGPDGSSTWVRRDEIELADAPKPAEPVKTAEGTFKVGDKVRAVGGSRGWGGVDEGDEGVVTGFDVDDGDIICSFPGQYRWFAQESDLELVEKVVEKKVRRKKLANHLYAVVHKDNTNDIELVTSDRDDAREYKAYLGGKDAGYIILKYEAVKEIR